MSANLPRLALALGLLIGVTGACRSAPRVRAPRAVPKLPVILVHGFAGQGTFSDGSTYFVGAPEALEQLGVAAFSVNLSPYGDSMLRSGQLAAFTDTVLKKTGATQVHVVGHSQGGIDTRYLIHERGYGDKIASLTTLTTPHRGTAVADLSVLLPDAMLDVGFYPFGWMARADDTLPIHPADAMRQLRPETMAAFNAAHPGNGGVPTFSVAAVTNANSREGCEGGAALSPPPRSGTTWWLLPTHMYLRYLVRAGPNDGLVSAKSARFGHFLGCVGADHVAVVGIGALPVGPEDTVEFAPVPFLVQHLPLLFDVERGLYDHLATP